MTVATEVDLSPINDLRDRLLSHLPGLIQRIVMYGSYARGEAEDGSDVDILVVVKESSPAIIEKTRAVRYEVMERHKYYPLLTLLVLSDKEWQELANRSAGLKYNIEREGITIWPRT